jgi:hypothetical protein
MIRSVRPGLYLTACTPNSVLNRKYMEGSSWKGRRYKEEKAEERESSRKRELRGFIIDALCSAFSTL